MANPILVAQGWMIRLLHGLTRRKIILVACMPKSGSTFLTKQLAALPGVQEVPLVPGYGRREQEISGSRLFWLSLALPHKHLVAQHHLRCSQTTLELIAAFNVQTIVLTRNIEDIVMSACEHFDNESTVSPMAYWDEALLADAARTGQSRFAVVFRTLAPWLLNFYLSWKFGHAQLTKDLQPIFLKYENFFSALDQNFATLLDRLGLPRQTSAMTVAGDNMRLNKGQVGRGTAELGADMVALEVWRGLRACYPAIDFNAPIAEPQT